MKDYRRIFAEAHGDGPHDCHFCGESVLEGGSPKTATSLVIHHIDLDPTNHDVANLAAAHQNCHVSYHGVNRREQVRVVRSAERPARIRAVNIDEADIICDLLDLMGRELGMYGQIEDLHVFDDIIAATRTAKAEARRGIKAQPRSAA